MEKARVKAQRAKVKTEAIRPFAFCALPFALVLERPSAHLPIYLLPALRHSSLKLRSQ
jgi:hypothetical protein